MEHLSYLKSEGPGRCVSGLFASQNEKYEREFFVLSPHSGVSYISASAAALLGWDCMGESADVKKGKSFDAFGLTLTDRCDGGAVRAAEVNSVIGTFPAMVSRHFTGERVVWLLPELCNLAADVSYPTVMRRLCRFFRGIPQIIDKAVKSGAEKLSGEMLAEFMSMISEADSASSRSLMAAKKNDECQRFRMALTKRKNGEEITCAEGDDNWLHTIRRKAVEHCGVSLRVTSEGDAYQRKSVATFQMPACGSVSQYRRLIKNIMKDFKESCNEEGCIEELSSERFLAILTLAVSACLRLKPDRESSMRIEETEDDLVICFDRIRQVPDSNFSWTFSGLVLKALGAECCVENDKEQSCLYVRMKKKGDFIGDVRRAHGVRFSRRIDCVRRIQKSKYASNEEYFCFIGEFYNGNVETKE